MDGILEYLAWRGDLPFCPQVPVNTVDLLIFSELVHAPFESLADRNGTLLSMKDRLFPSLPVKDDSNMDKTRRELWDSMPRCRRFAEVRLVCFDSAFDPENEMQFAGALFDAGGTGIVAFRGTDGTLVGWKEDLNMSYAAYIPSQLRALTFLNLAVREAEKAGIEKLHVCGHSKGGNLAMYAASQCIGAVKERIIQVTGFDAPGVGENITRTSGWAEIKDKLELYIPEASVIGLLLDTGAPKHVVDSDSVSILQHNPFKWHVMGTELVCVEETTRVSRYTEQVIRDFLAGCDTRKRRQIVEAIYDVLETCKVKHIRDIPLSLITHRAEIKKVMAQKPLEEQKTLGEILTRLLSSGGENLIKQLLR